MAVIYERIGMRDGHWSLEFVMCLDAFVLVC